MKRLLFLLLPLGASAALVSETYSSAILNLAIPDFQSVLTPSLLSIGGSAIVSLSRVEVAFELTGTPGAPGFAGDMVVSLLRTPLGQPLSAADAKAVLLDQVSGAFNGWNVLVRDGEAAGIQTAAPTLVSAVLAGGFAPAESLDAAFAGLSANADWRLNVGDLSAGGTMQLVRWSVILTGETAPAVPESGTGGAGVMVLAGGGWWLRTRRR